MPKLICVVGPTATGKTKKAIEIFKQQPSILISADSRQVYRDMDIVTGKDHPQDITIYGLDLVNPDDRCSVSVWYASVMPYIKRAWAEGKQVIIVGGTGLYVKAITDGIDTIQVPINQNLRDELVTLSVAELQRQLFKLNPPKLASMNNSDANNPRRLIRAIEVATSSISLPTSPTSLPESSIIGLKYANQTLQRSQIHARVISRLNLGAVAETKLLLKQYDRSLPSMSAIGYKSIIQFLENKIDEATMINAWIDDELAYSKRQLTWFRKQPTIWYDVDTIGAI